MTFKVLLLSSFIGIMCYFLSFIPFSTCDFISLIQCITILLWYQDRMIATVYYVNNLCSVCTMRFMKMCYTTQSSETLVKSTVTVYSLKYLFIVISSYYNVNKLQYSWIDYSNGVLADCLSYYVIDSSIVLLYHLIYF